MSRQAVIFIVNPNAGRKRSLTDFEYEVMSFIDLTKFDPHFEYTEYRGHASEIVSKYINKKFKFYIAVGGDGTVNEVATQLINTDFSLFIIPRGSGNGLARHLGYMLTLEESLIKLNKSVSKKIDTATVNGLSFFCTSGLGFDAYCAQLFDKNAGKRGLINYIKIALKGWFSYRSLKIEFNKQAYNSLYSITFGNANQFGNNAYICPKAIIDDGFLDVSIISPPKTHQVPGLLLKLFKGNLDESRLCEYYRGKTFEIKTSSPVQLHLDGEPHLLNTNTLIFSILENSLHVLI